MNLIVFQHKPHRNVIYYYDSLLNFPFSIKTSDHLSIVFYEESVEKSILYLEVLINFLSEKKKKMQIAVSLFVI